MRPASAFEKAYTAFPKILTAVALTCGVGREPRGHLLRMLSIVSLWIGRREAACGRERHGMRSEGQRRGV